VSTMNPFGGNTMSRSVIIALALLVLVGLGSANADPQWATFEIKAELTEDIYPGQTTDLDIDLIRADQEFGGFDLLVEFDPNALRLETVEQGDVLTSCGWEFFEAREDPGFVRIVSVADVVGVPGSPTCYGSVGNLARLHFTVLVGAPKGAVAPIRFHWVDCGDNSISNIIGDTLFISDEVMNWDGEFLTGIPTYGGASRDCMPGGEDGVIAPWIEFNHGGVRITVPTGCDPDGNGIPWTVSDMVFLIQYVFLGGPSADPIEDGDCNCDGAYNLSDITQLVHVGFRGGEDPCNPEE